MVGKTPMCDAHYRSAMGMPALNGRPAFDIATELARIRETKKNQEETTMAVDKAALQRDRDAGMSPADIAKKHGVPAWQVYQYSKAKTGAKPAAAKVLGGGRSKAGALCA